MQVHTHTRIIGTKFAESKREANTTKTPESMHTAPKNNANCVGFAQQTNAKKNSKIAKIRKSSNVQTFKPKNYTHRTVHPIPFRSRLMWKCLQFLL